MQVQALGRDGPLEEEMATCSVFLPGEFHGQRSLVGYSLWGHQESDTTERLSSTAESIGQLPCHHSGRGISKKLKSPSYLLWHSPSIK